MEKAAIEKQREDGAADVQESPVGERTKARREDGESIEAMARYRKSGV